MWQISNCREALSLTIRYGYLTAGDFAVFCVQPPSLQHKMMGFVHRKSGNGSARLNSRLGRLLAVLILCLSPVRLNSVSLALFKQTVFIMGKMPRFTG